MGKTAFVFPGQGSQYVGMGKELVENFPVAKRIFEEANDALGLNIGKICFEGPDEELVKTENTQPAILTTSIAILRVLEEEGLTCDITAGLSLGEYTSLVQSNAFQFHDAVQLVKKRGRYMQEAVPFGVGQMAAIIGLPRGTVEKCLQDCRKHGIVEAANYNSPGQIVISGETKAVQKAVEEASLLGARKAVILPVSAPFHCSLLKPAGEKLQRDLETLKINKLKTPVIANATAKILSSKEEVVPSLVQQVSKSVLWEDTIEVMLQQGVENFVEIGPGKTLNAFIRRIAKNLDRKVNITHVENLETLKALTTLRTLTA